MESLGIPLPGETALVLASIYAGTTHRLSPWLIFAAAGFFAGGLERLSLTIDLVLGGIAALVIIGGIILLRRRMAGLTERAEKAYPGPLE